MLARRATCARAAVEGRSARGSGTAVATPDPATAAGDSTVETRSAAAPADTAATAASVAVTGETATTATHRDDGEDADGAGPTKRITKRARRRTHPSSRRVKM